MNKLVAALTVSAIAAGSLATFALAQASAPTEAFTMRVMPGDMGLLGPDQKHHDSMEPASFVLHKGVKVTLTIINYDDSGHTISAPDMNLLAMVAPGIKLVPGATSDTKGEIDLPRPESGVKPVVTTVTFTPATAGQFRWNCLIPCDGDANAAWAMSDGVGGPGQLGYMAGYFTVL